jgi:hypothetical protein
MSDWRERLTADLEPKLRVPDPRPLISAYHDMPYAIFRYPARHPPRASVMNRLGSDRARRLLPRREPHHHGQSPGALSKRDLLR